MQSIPGTQLTVDTLDEAHVSAVLDTLFLSGGLVLSQVIALTGIEEHTIQNWVRRGFVSAPVSRKYSKRQVCRLIIIQMLKDILPIGSITGMLSYINGSLSDESDDRIRDDLLYLRFISALADNPDGSKDARTSALRSVEKMDGLTKDTANRLINVLETMLHTYYAKEERDLADQLIRSYSPSELV